MPRISLMAEARRRWRENDMDNPAKATYEDVNLVLKLYELRREETLREARAWFMSQFFPRTIDDFKELSAPGHSRNASFRMVLSYWDMAASFAVQGPLNAALLLESSGELLLTWAKLEPFIAEIREWAQMPDFLRNLEEIIRHVDWAPRRIQWLQ